jgi:hypothetical protein
VPEPVKLIVRAVPAEVTNGCTCVLTMRPPADAFFAVTLKPLMALVTEKFQATDHSPVVAFTHRLASPTTLASIANPSTVWVGAAVAEAEPVGASDRRVTPAAANSRAVRVRIIDLLLVRGLLPVDDAAA